MRSFVRTRLRRACYVALLTATILTTPSAPVFAGETLTYSYDALGRMVKVARAGTVNNNATECYNYDPASNRSNVTVSTTSNCTTSSVSFSVNDASVTEGGNLVFTVTKTGANASSVTVNYAVVAGTAVLNTNYNSSAQALSGTLTFAASSGNATQTVTVHTIDETTADPPLTVLLNLSNPSTGTTISDTQGVGTIIDNDGGGSGTNHPPVAVPDSLTVRACGSGRVNVLANDSDPDGNIPLVLQAVSSGTNGDVSFTSDGWVTYSAFVSTGTDSLSYTVADSLGATSTGTLSVTISGGQCMAPPL